MSAPGRAARGLAATLLLACGAGDASLPEPVPFDADSEPLLSVRDNEASLFEGAKVGSDARGRWLEFGLDAPNRQANLPINNPPVVHARHAIHMDDDDTVVGILLGDSARAYPWWILSSGHLVNDLLSGRPVLVTMCEACSGASAFLASLDDYVLDFRVGGIRDGTWYAIDHQTGSSWHPFRGLAWRGPLEGRKLRRLRSYLARWGDWRRDHPQSSVLLGGPEMRHRRHARSHGELKRPGTPRALDLPVLRPETPNPRRSLLPDHELLFGLVPEGRGVGRAYPLAALQRAGGVVQEEVDGRPVLLVQRGDLRVGAYLRRLGSRVLELEVAAREPLRLRDQEGSLWDAWGRAVSGPSEGQTLAPADGYLTEWYEWQYGFPRSEIFGTGAG